MFGLWDTGWDATDVLAEEEKNKRAGLNECTVRTQLIWYRDTFGRRE